MNIRVMRKKTIRVLLPTLLLLLWALPTHAVLKEKAVGKICPECSLPSVPLFTESRPVGF